MAICCLPSMMIQMALAKTRPPFRRAGRSHRWPLCFDAALLPHVFDVGQSSIVFSSYPLDHETPASRFPRSPDAVIEPSGNARAATTLRRKGVFDPTVPKSGSVAERVTREDAYEELFRNARRRGVPASKVISISHFFLLSSGLGCSKSGQ